MVIYGVKVKFNEKQIIILISMTAIFAVILAVVTTVHFQNKYNQLSQEFNQYKTGYQTKTFSIGESVNTADFSLLVNSVDIDSVGIPGYLPVPEGMEFIAVDLTLRNKTSSENIFLPLFDTYLRDAQGTKYELTVAPNVQSGAAGRIAAGDTIKGQLGFLVPVGVENLRFYFEPFNSTTSTVVVELEL